MIYFQVIFFVINNVFRKASNVAHWLAHCALSSNPGREGKINHLSLFLSGYNWVQNFDSRQNALNRKMNIFTINVSTSPHKIFFIPISVTL